MNTLRKAAGKQVSDEDDTLSSLLALHEQDHGKLQGASTAAQTPPPQDQDQDRQDLDMDQDLAQDLDQDRSSLEDASNDSEEAEPEQQ